MPRIYRNIFFFVFVLLFLVTTPLAVLYSQGYRFDQYKNIFIHSGSVTIKSTPSSVNVYLDGELQPTRSLDIINNSITINGLRPGNYDVKVTADNYSTWGKNIEVHSGLSTEFWNVLLTSKSLTSKELAGEGAERYFPSPFGKKIALVKKDGNKMEIWSLLMSTNVPALIYSAGNAEFSKNIHDNIEWNSDEKTMLVPFEAESGKDFAIVDSEQKTEPMLLSQMSGLAEKNHARWSPDSQQELYFLAKTSDEESTSLYRVDLDTRKTDLISPDVAAYDLSSSALYVVRKNNIIYKTDLEGKNEEQLIFTPIDFSEAPGDIRIISYDDKRQAVISEDGEFFVHNDGETGEILKKIKDGVQGVQFSNDGKKLLFWTNNDIGAMFLREWDVQPRREENEIQQVVRFSVPIKNIFWYRDYEHVFFSTQGTVKIIELDSRDHRIVDNVFKYNSDNFTSSYDTGNGIYYFLDETNGTKKLFEVYIPEQTNILGM